MRKASGEAGQTWAAARAGFGIRGAVGLILILVGCAINRRVFDIWGADFAPQYVSAWLLREGKNVYDFHVQTDGYIRHVGAVTTWAHFYPPGAAVIAIPATILPYATAREVWFVLAIAVTLIGLWRFMAAYVPAFDRPTRLLVLGLILCASCTRWSFKVAQPGSMVLGLFGLFLAELKAERPWTAFLCGAFVGATKVTFAIPFVLMALAQRRIKLVVAMFAFWTALNVVGIYGMGGPAILEDYRANLAQFERPDQLNYPDPRGFNSLARTDWPYILNAVHADFARNSAIGLALSILSLAWLGYEVLRGKGRTRDDDVALALAASIAALSMLVVYHHHYDMGLLLMPVLAFVGRKEFRALGATWVYVVPVVLYAGLFPYEKADQIMNRLLGPAHVLVTKPLACFVCIVALGASFVVLRAALKFGREVAPRASIQEATAAGGEST